MPEGCIVDLSIEAALPPDEAAVKALLARGREIYYLARVDWPSPILPVDAIWTATFLPPTPERVDLGYWLSTGPRTVRVEARAPSERLSDCKERLDEIVRALTGGEGFGAAPTEPDGRTDPVSPGSGARTSPPPRSRG